jgi:hypothetical protein
MKKRTIGPTLRIAEAITGPRENDTLIGRIAQRLAEIRHMITLEDCIGMCGLTEEEILAIAEHEHLPEVAATALAQYLLSREHGSEKIRDMIVDDIREAQWNRNKEHVLTLLHVLHHFLLTHPEARPSEHPWSHRF